MKNDSLFLFSCLTVIQYVASQNMILHRHYVRCPISSATIGHGPDTMIGRSVLQCTVRCAEREWCEGVTICPVGGSSQVKCRMENDTSLGQCEQEHIPGSCHLEYRVTSVTTEPLSLAVTTTRASLTTDETSVTTEPALVTTAQTSVTTEKTSATTEMVCQNGGTLTDNTCNCPSPFVGATCQRYMRDCQEGYGAGHSTTPGVYSIQPRGVPAPFKVRCSDGITYGFMRIASASAVPWTSMSWNDAKHGVGDDLSVLNSASNPENFFLGLIKLRQIVSQAKYSNHVFFMYDNWSEFGSPTFNNFTLGAESSNFPLSYKEFLFINGNEADNGLDANDPIVFSTADHDTNGCAGRRGAPGWYGTGCHGYSVFADPPLWPVGGVDKKADVFIMNLQRMSDFYDD